ncbi:MAG: PqqD family protein [Pseudomonadota bacterium]
MRVFKKHAGTLQLTRGEALIYKPIKNLKIKEARLETGEVLLTYPTKMRPWIADLIRKFGGAVNEVQPKKLQLDELGTAVWDLMDGRRSVLQIIKGFAKKYDLQTREAEVAVTQFLRMLGKRGIIGLK